MDRLKSIGREGLGKQVLNEDKSSSRLAQHDATTRKRQRLSDAPKSIGDTQVVPEGINARKSIQNDVPKPRPCMLPLLPVPNVQQVSSSWPVILKGTASAGVAGPAVGSVDIGTSESAYYFRVSLPGVKKDPGEFSCTIERDGRVRVRGVTTTGSSTVEKCSRVYTMKLQQQCSPGPFTLSFRLPGPVDPRLFSPNFRADGIFEGVVLKSE
ncbi:OLC1v1016150C1 [Oldenlandia corymbosa var. corymbosa]|uniref:OLC1v1016150C1 n=1 Tax=Oldenlandia corymbosa var. corymbosa TaxID=529605 RepID=A0AAV1E5D3_OLDCO|nr:OLC1v1016150C1 [Oldenlandia corymbosa var. corymbosa]